jgi:hypothetical protein
MTSIREINELHSLHDDALVTNPEAAAFLGYKPFTLAFNRSQAPERGPDFVRIGGKSIRYRMGDLRAFAAKGQAKSVGVCKAATASLVARGLAPKAGT